MRILPPPFVMAGLAPAIYELLQDARIESGHDGIVFGGARR